MLTGDNGILTRAGEAKERTDEEQIIEKAKMDILANQTSKMSGKINEKELKSILSKYGTLSTEESITDKKLTTTDGKYVIPVSKIYNGKVLETTIENTDPKNYYGDLIDYDVDIGVSLDDKDQYDWKIFYNDGTNIYIIAEDYVRMDNALMPEIQGRTENSSNPYSLYWPWNSGNIQNGKNGSADIFGAGTSKNTLNFANNYLKKWKTALGDNTSTNSNAKMVATLLDTDLWSYNSSTGKGYTNSTKIQSLSSNNANDFFAIGGPTLEMWVESWNKKHGSDSEDENKLQLYYASNATGYFVGKSENPDTTADGRTGAGYLILAGETTGYTDTLYYPHTSILDNCCGYWLVSPSAGSAKGVLYARGDGTVYVSRFCDDYYGLRPVVCLPSDITATWNETDGVWNIIKK